MSSSDKDPQADQQLTGIDKFVSVRLHVLVNVNERAATLLYGRKFGINLPEWRVMAVLGGCEEGLSVNQVAIRGDLDKSQVSRAVAALVKRRYISRRANKEDARSVILTLTPSGRAQYEVICNEEGLSRQERLLSCLTKTERTYLDRALDKLINQARVLYREEKEAAAAAPENKAAAKPRSRKAA